MLIADDQPLVRTGLRTILDNAGGFDIVGEAADGQQALAQAGALRPDVVLMDIRMPRLDGIAATRTKLGLRDRVQAVVFAYDTGLTRPGE